MMIDAEKVAQHLLWVWFAYGKGSHVEKETRLVYLEHRNMAAGEDAMDFLQGLGLVIDQGYGCHLTRKGLDLMGLQETTRVVLVGADETSE